MSDFEALKEELATLPLLPAGATTETRARNAMQLAVGRKDSPLARVTQVLVPVALTAAVLVYLSWAVEAAAALYR